MTTRRIGVEEEMLLVDPATGHLTAASARVVETADDDVEQELFLQQLEIQTDPTDDLDDLRGQLRSARRRAALAAERAGAALLVSPTPVLGGDPHDVTPKARYDHMISAFGAVGRQAITCGMHVHVEVADDVEAVRIADAVRPWLPLVVALSAGSPFDHGADTGLASWREQVWDAWPSAGPGEPFGDVRGYREVVERLVSTGAAIDAHGVYFDVRLAEDLPTVELRVADVCTDLDDTVLVAALLRALAETASHESEPAAWRVELLRAARWRARRDGLEGHLVDPLSRQLVPAADALATMLDHLDAALRESGDRELAHDGVQRLLTLGSNAARLRHVAGEPVDLDAVVRDLRTRTDASWQDA
ncbi:carboxylate-amine ligase [Aeromicrobium sp. Root495]|uniref:carboxylate-amine ligase n=1 Tax=Aeromicrobium sp. Root495 TaxID=1736550 RepID=UPI0012E70117|nr:glutamate--cysteine ligase [Aeromicrobium sp. Root495]